MTKPSGIEVYRRLARPANKGAANALANDSSSVDLDKPSKILSTYMPIQSWLDEDLLETAIAVQPANIAIMPDTNGKVREEATSGYSLGLAPWSEAPMAFRFYAGGQSDTSDVVVMKPGEIITPQGLGLAGTTKSGAFSGFQYGLPFGWLGGGNVYIYVFPTHTSNAFWTATRGDVLFHRQTIVVYGHGEDLRAINNTVGNGPNWPNTFPWAAGRNMANQLQVGQPSLTVTPTRTLFRVRLDGGGPVITGHVSAVIRNTSPFDIGPDGISLVTPPVVSQLEDVYFPASLIGVTETNAQAQIDGGLLASNYGPNARLDLISDATAHLENFYIDILRFGLLG